jgi:hypothetical protein
MALVGKHDVGSMQARRDHHSSLQSLSNTLSSFTRGKRNSVAGSVGTGHSRRQSQDTQHGRRGQLEMMDPANIVG